MTESQLNPDTAVYSETVLAGDYWIHEISAARIFASWIWRETRPWTRLFYNARDTAERYSATDTIVASAIST